MFVRNLATWTAVAVVWTTTVSGCITVESSSGGAPGGGGGGSSGGSAAYEDTSGDYASGEVSSGAADDVGTSGSEDSVQGANSCAGRCFSVDKGAPCHCDVECVKYSDCCGDFAFQCTYARGDQWKFFLDDLRQIAAESGAPSTSSCMDLLGLGPEDAFGLPTKLVSTHAEDCSTCWTSSAAQGIMSTTSCIATGLGLSDDACATCVLVEWLCIQTCKASFGEECDLSDPKGCWDVSYDCWHGMIQSDP